MGLVEALGGVLRSHMHELHARGMDEWKLETEDTVQGNIACTKGSKAIKSSSLPWRTMRSGSWWEVLSGFNTWTMTWPSSISLQMKQGPSKHKWIKGSTHLSIKINQINIPISTRSMTWPWKMESLKCELVKPKRSPLSKCHWVLSELQTPFS